MHRSVQINLAFYKFIILIRMLLSFIWHFLNRICLIQLFFIWSCFFTITRTRFSMTTFSQSTSLLQWIHERGKFPYWDNASWYWAMACRNWEFQWKFTWCNNEVSNKLVQHHFKSKPIAGIYICITILVRFECWHYFTFFNNIFLYLVCQLLSWNSQSAIKLKFKNQFEFEIPWNSKITVCKFIQHMCNQIFVLSKYC